MSEQELHRLRDELDSWRARFDHIRVQANLGKRELRDNLHELGERLQPAHAKAKKRLGELARAGATEARALARGLQAAWADLQRTHRELLEGAGREEAARQAQRRK